MVPSPTPKPFLVHAAMQACLREHTKLLSVVEEPVEAMDEEETQTPTAAAETQVLAADAADALERLHSAKCWLCEYHGNAVCDKATAFVVDSIAHMSFASLVAQLQAQIHAQYPDENVSVAQITTHIREHMLHPRVKVARMLQRMSDMQAAITQNITTEDAETGTTVIDASAVKLYASLCNQVAALYKLDEDKLMFRSMSMDK